MKRVALKFCGGCDPDFDRGEYWERLKQAAGKRIQWVGLEETGWGTVLLLQGCTKACLERELKFSQEVRVVPLRDEGTRPEKVIKILLGEPKPGEEG